MKKWYSISNLASNETEILIYDIIGQDYWGDGISAKEFVRDLSNIKTDFINVRINSPGGSVFDGIAIYNALKAHKATINVYIESLAASIASVIAMAGDTVYMANSSLMMVHEVQGGSYGTSSDHMAQAHMQDQAKEIIIRAYKTKSESLSDDEISQLMINETWMTTEDALQHGFIDEIMEDVKMAASIANYDKSFLSNYKKTPDNLKDEIDADQEKASKPITADEAKNLINELYKLLNIEDKPPEKALNGRSVHLLKNELELINLV